MDPQRTLRCPDTEERAARRVLSMAVPVTERDKNRLHERTRGEIRVFRCPNTAARAAGPCGSGGCVVFEGASMTRLGS